MDTLDEFYAASGLKVNVEKSKAICSTNTSRRVKDSLSNASSINFIANLGRYLGYPLLHGRSTRADFLFIVEKIKSRLASLKGRLLNMAGRVALANSVLTAIPIYSMNMMW